MIADLEYCSSGFVDTQLLFSPSDILKISVELNVSAFHKGSEIRSDTFRRVRLNIRGHFRSGMYSNPYKFFGCQFGA